MIRLAALTLMLLPNLVAADRWQWRDLPPLPRALGCAFAGVIDHHLIVAGFAATRNNVPIVLSGSDGALAPFEANLAADHPGFSPLIWSFNGTSWLPMGRLPYAPVTATLVDHQGKLVIAGGEDRPAHRSARVLSGELLP